MRRYVKVLAAGALVGTQALPGYVSVAGAQTSKLEPVTISGRSSGGSSTGCYPNCTVPGSGYTSGGGASPAPSFPESEAHTKPVTLPPAPSPKSAEQILKDKQACTKEAEDQTKLLDQQWQAEMNKCVARESNWVGAAYEILAGIVGQSCMGRTNKWRDEKKFEINLARQACYAKVEKP